MTPGWKNEAVGSREHRVIISSHFYREKTFSPFWSIKNPERGVKSMIDNGRFRKKKEALDWNHKSRNDIRCFGETWIPISRRVHIMKTSGTFVPSNLQCAKKNDSFSKQSQSSLKKSLRLRPWWKTLSLCFWKKLSLIIGICH